MIGQDRVRSMYGIQIRWIVLFLGLLVLFLAHGMALLFRVQPAVSLWFPPSGIAIALALWFGPISLVPTWIASFITAPLWGNHGWMRLASLTDTIEPLVAWLLYCRYFKASLSLNSVRDAVALLVSGPIAACGASSIFGSLALVAFGQMSPASLPYSIPPWWIGNALGTMAIVPSALLFATQNWQWWRWMPLIASSKQSEAGNGASVRRQFLDIAIILALGTATAWLSVWGIYKTVFVFQHFSLLSFIPIVWAASRFGVRGGMLTVSFCVLVTLINYLILYPSAISSSQFPISREILYTHQLSLLIQCGIGMLVGTAVTERINAQAALAAQQVRQAEYEAHAQLSENLLQFNQRLTEANQQLQQSEAIAKAQAEELRQKQDWLDLAQEAAKVGSFEWNIQANVNTWSKELEILYGLQPGEFGGTYEEWAKLVHPEDLAKAEADVLSSLTTGECFTEWRVVWPDGSIHWLNARARIFYDAEGEPLRMVGINVDITEQKLAIEERAHALERERAARIELEKASKMKDEFLAIVSHELRSPLNAILGWSRLLRTRKFDSETKEKALASIERNAQAQTQLIEDLLDISRIIRGMVRLNLRPVSLVPIVQAALDTIRPTAEAKSIQLESQIPPNLGLVSGDGERLQQIVWNLLSNAVKFTPTGGRVVLRLENIGSYVHLQVIDSGKGISPDFLPHVFDQFRQADATTTRTQGGLGLGLAIVRNLAELHGGTIHADSAGEGLGATFTMKLPMLPIKEEERREGERNNTSSPSHLLTPSPLSGLQVLVVDDEADTREFLVTALEQFGATATSAASVAEALTLFQQNRPDVILSDIGMPQEDGYALIRKIRALPPEAGGQTPAAALTAYVRGEDRLEALAAGFQVHIPKPIEPMQLLKVMVRLAGRN